jgi:hypothetical protein
MLEMALANIVVSLPGLKPLVNRSSKYEATNVVIETKN